MSGAGLYKEPRDRLVSDAVELHDLAARAALEILEDDRAAPRQRQRAQRLAETGRICATHDDTLGDFGSERFGDRCQRSFARQQHVLRGVLRNPIQPRARVDSGPKRARSQCALERILNNVFGIRRSNERARSHKKAGALLREQRLVDVVFVLDTLSMTVAELVEEALAPLDMRLRHYRSLRLLMYEGPQLQSAIGPVLGVDRTSVVVLVDDLERLKLAKRARSEDDRRAYRVALTEKGKKTVAKATALVSAVEHKIFAPLTEREQQLLRQLSTRLLLEPGIIADAFTKTVRGVREASSRA
jgi:DNA-binding MarR family transcriptional regulator